MLTIEFESVSLKGAFSTEPLIDHNPKGVLITGRTRMALDLLRSHVIGRSTNTLCALQGSGSGLSNCGDAKVTDQDLTLLPNQEILRFDIAVDHTLVMGVLESLSNLFNILHDQWQGNLRSCRMSLP